MKSSSIVALILVGFSLMIGGPTACSQENGASARLQIPDTDDGLPGQGPIRRYDWFRKTWHDRRAKFAAAAERDRNAIVMLGDSITQGWDDDFTAWFPGMKVANRGISGDTSRGV